MFRKIAGLYFRESFPNSLAPPIAGASPFSTIEKDSMLNNFATRALFVGAHSSWPGDSGANELSGAPYSRQAITWSASSGGSIASATTPAIPIPAGNTVAFLGIWSLVTAGTFRGWAARAGGVPTPFELDDTTEPDLFRCNNHAFVADQQVILMDTSGAGAVIPGGFVEGTIYFVRLTGLSDVTDTFQLAATAGGAAIAATTDGAGFVQSLTPQLYATAGTETVSSAQFDLLR